MTAPTEFAVEVDNRSVGVQVDPPQTGAPQIIIGVHGLTGPPGGGGGGGGPSTIGDVTGLTAALNSKVDKNTAITAATKTKLTYDAKGLVTAGADAAVSDITGLQPALDGKAATVHTHTEAEVTGLTVALAAKESIANRGAVNGYTPLDASQLVPAIYLPSYVDDVLEFANLAGFPGTGTAGKIYVALDTNKVYRWSGSAYVEISSSPGSTDAVTEGATNLYYTPARADGRIAAARGVTVQAYDADLDTWATKTPPSGAVVGTTDTQTLTNKTLDATNTVEVPATSLTIRQVADPTRKAQFNPINSSTGTTNVFNLPSQPGTLSCVGNTETLQNKRITKRVATIASSATPTFATDTTDQAEMLTLATNITSATFSGTPTAAQVLTLVFKSASAQTIALGSSVVAGPAPLLAATAAGKYHEMVLKWNSTATKWVVMASDATGYT